MLCRKKPRYQGDEEVVVVEIPEPKKETGR
jgi:hypothetical protein